MAGLLDKTAGLVTIFCEAYQQTHLCSLHPCEVQVLPTHPKGSCRCKLEVHVQVLASGQKQLQYSSGADHIPPWDPCAADAYCESRPTCKGTSPVYIISLIHSAATFLVAAICVTVDRLREAEDLLFAQITPVKEHG